jgi:signal transduction histidine kinase
VATYERRVKASLERAMNELLPYKLEFRVPLRDGGMRWLAAQSEPCAANGGDRSLLGLMQDITERKSAEEAMRRAERRKDEFLAMLAHELRNPLAPIRNAAEILRLIESDDPRLRRAIRIIDGQSSHMERLIEDLLDVARIAQGRLDLRRETLALTDVLTQALELSRHRIEERGQHLELKLYPTPVYLNGDPVRLCQIFANLLDNAAKYTQEGGEIRMLTRLEGEQVLVRISDNGRGISADELPFLFDGPARQRTRAPPPLSGLGLGLSIVKRLVEMHGGSVLAESPGVDSGSCFSVRLPVVPDSSPTGRQASPRVSRQIPKARILVVDDDRDIAESTALLLQSLGHEVDLASGGEEALRQARHKRHRLVLLDIGLLDSDGMEIARRLRQLPHGRDMRIAAVTGYGDARTRREARAAGIDRHLLKPLSLDVLQELVRSLSG